MLSALPDELLHKLLVELDAAAACRLSQADKAMQQWVRLHHREWVLAWWHARAWLMLCDYAKARVQHRWASIRGRRSVVWNHFTSVSGSYPYSFNRVYMRCCCTKGIANGNTCGVVLNVNNTAPLWNHLRASHPILYAHVRSNIQSHLTIKKTHR